MNPLKDVPRHVIEPGAEVLNGVFLARAGIVVDIDENPEPYETVLADIDARLSRPDDWVDREITLLDTLWAVHESANKFAPFNKLGYAEVLKDEAARHGVDRVSPEHHIGLSTFIAEQTGYFTRPIGGICHEHSLLSAAMIRLLQLRGDVGEGDVDVRRRTNHPDEHTIVELTLESEWYQIDWPTGVIAPRRRLVL